MTAGSVWMIQTPPSNCSQSAYWNGMTKMNTSAPALITSETIFAIWLSSASVQSGWMNSRQTLRVKVLAVAIDMIAAGTNAPIPMAANATPTNQDGNNARNNAGTEKLL